MDFEPTEEQQMLRALAREIGQRYRPHILEWEAGGVPADVEREMIDTLQKRGLLGMTIPEEYGGQNRPFIDMIVVLEEFAKLAPPLAGMLLSSCSGPVQIIMAFGNEEIKRKYLSAIVRGEALVSVAMTEPDAGSATTELKTSATLVGDRYVINGTKVFVGGGGRHELYVVYVRLDGIQGARGVGALVVERGTPGLEFGRDLALLSQKFLSRYEVVFKDCAVPRENLLVKAGDFPKLMGSFNTERVHNSALCVGVAAAAFEDSLQYAQERRQFGKSLVEFQMIQDMLAEMATDLEAARLLVYRAATKVRDNQAPALDASYCKAFASKAARQITDMAVQIHGAYGLSGDLPIQRYWRDARGLAIAAGTEQIQKVRIVSELTGLRFNQRG